MKTKNVNKVLATGISMITPIGRTVEQNWENLITSMSAIRYLDDIKGGCQIGGRLPDYELPKTQFNTKIHSLAKALAIDLFEDAQFDPLTISDKEKWRTGCIIANQYGVQEINLKTAGSIRLIKQMPHVVSSMLCIDYQLRGQNGSPAGASIGSAMAIGEAYRLIKDGYMDRVIVGGCDYNCNDNVIGGMDAFGALCQTHNNDPEHACMPFDKKRTGTVISDGGAIILLESEEFAFKRKAKQIYAEIIGYGQTNDAISIMKPLDNGLGILAGMMAALNDAGLHPLEMDAVNCHARSTVAGDSSEAYCLNALFACGNHVKTAKQFQKLSPEDVIAYYNQDPPKEQPYIQDPQEPPVLFGQKGHLGHTVAAAGAIETVFGMLAIKHQHIPAIKNLRDPIEPMLNYAMKNHDRKVNVVMKNAFVFGGVNSSILFKKY